MAIEVGQLTDLDADKVQQAEELIAQMVQEDNPALDVKRGVLKDLVWHYSGILAAANQENIDRWRRSSSLKEITEDPALADDDIVDGVLSNWGITREAGQAATGSITIIVDTLATATVSNGAIFEADGKEFAANASYVARTSTSSVTSETDRVLSPVGDGTYSFTVEVTAVADGSASMINKDTLAVPQVQISNFVKAFATSDFTGGIDAETNAALVLRQGEGVAAEAASNRVNDAALLRGDERFENYLHLSVIGYGDAEMQRDQHSILPISFGGRTDWYARSQARPQKVGLTKTATLIGKTADGKGNWQIDVARDEAPGFYDVVSIVPKDDNEFLGTFDITSEIRGTDVSAISGELLPDIESASESAYSRYQTAVVQFKDSQTDTASLTVGASTQDYTVTLRAMPLVSEMQTYVSNRDHRNHAGDILVKAPIPCFLSLSFTLNGAAGATLPDAFAVKDALADYVNNLGFCGRLHASDLLDIIHNFLTGKISVSAIDMFGQIRRPDGTIKPLRSSEVLIIPDESANMVTARTVGFILDPDNVKVSAQTVNIPEI